MIKLSEKGVFLASNNEIIAEEHLTGAIKKEEAKKGTIAWSIPVSYTHLDVYKRQLIDHRIIHIHQTVNVVFIQHLNELQGFINGHWVRFQHLSLIHISSFTGTVAHSVCPSGSAINTSHCSAPRSI